MRNSFQELVGTGHEAVVAGLDGVYLAELEDELSGMTADLRVHEKRAGSFAASEQMMTFRFCLQTSEVEAGSTNPYTDIPCTWADDRLATGSARPYTFFPCMRHDDSASTPDQAASVSDIFCVQVAEADRASAAFPTSGFPRCGFVEEATPASRMAYSTGSAYGCY